MHLKKDRSKEEVLEPKAICWKELNSSESDNIPKLNIHKIIYNRIIPNSDPILKIKDTAEDDYRSIDRDPIFEVHTVSKDGKTTDYSYIKLNATEYDANDTKNPYKRKTYSIGFTHRNTIVRNSRFKGFRTYSPNFINANSKRSNLGVSKTISYDMFEKVLEAINNFAENVKPYCEYNNNHEDFVYEVSKKAGIPGYTSTFSSFFGLSRHNLYKRQLKHMADKESYFDYFSEAGSPSEKYIKYNQLISYRMHENGRSFNTDINAANYFKLFNWAQRVKVPSIGESLNKSLLKNFSWEKIDNMSDEQERHIDKWVKEKSYDKVLALKSLQRNIFMPIFEQKRAEILTRKNEFKSEKYVTKKVTNNKYIEDSQIPRWIKDNWTYARFKTFAKDAPLFPNDEPKIEDIQQTKLGDCYLLAALISMVNTEKGKEFIKKAVIDNGDGTVTVTFFGEDKKITVDKTAPTNISKNALWVQMIEKAYAASNRLGYKNDVEGYDSIVSGSVNKFIERISSIDRTNKKIIEMDSSAIQKSFSKSKYKPSKLTQTEDYTLRQLNIWNQIQEGMKMNKNITFLVSRKSTGIETDHTYAITGYEKVGSHYFIKVVNPWSNRFGLKYYDIKNMKSKKASEAWYEKQDYFLFELSHFTDLDPQILIM